MTGPLSKTKYLSGLQCTKKLWFESNKSIDPSPLSAADQLIFDRGREVEAVYKDQLEKFADASSRDIEEAAEKTLKLINTGEEQIFQATFTHADYGVRVDFLERSTNGTWNIVEVKVSSKVKDEHIPDAAFQRYVAELAGIKVDRCFIVHLNRDCMFPDLSNLFTRVDITDQVNDILPGIQENTEQFLKSMRGGEEPTIRIGKRCSKPHDCRFTYHCWKDVPKHSIFTVPRISEDKLNSLMDEDIIEVVAIPDNFKLTANQKKYVDLIKEGIPKIDRVEILRILNTLEFPLYFLDFEADRPPIPLYNGMRSYDLLPFQYSLHILETDGCLTHKYYLHDENTDSRAIIASELDRNIGSTGSVVVYNKDFEKGVLEDLANFASDHAPKMLSIRDRLWDQCDIFGDSYMHPDFAGSCSLKDVLQTLVPTLSYEDLTVRNGNNAVAAWVKMLKITDAKEKEQLKSALLEYCKLDSLAMVEIHKHLVALTTA